MKILLLLILLFALLSFFVPMKSNYNKGIPKIIHQSAMADKTKWHKIWKRCQKSWQEKFPDFEYKMWHDEDLDEFMKTNYPDFYQNVYLKYDINIKRFDSARYFILYHFGGMYADMDFECIENFWEHIPQDKVSIVETPIPHYGGKYENALMIGPKGDPFWKKIMDKLPDRSNKHVFEATGPSLITEVINEPNVINPLVHEDYSDLTAKFTRHYWTGSWNNWSSGHGGGPNFEGFRKEPSSVDPFHNSVESW
jgi:mannosyltransferase OCH1-like enzyme